MAESNNMSFSLDQDQYCHDLEQKHSDLGKKLGAVERERDTFKSSLNLKIKEVHDAQSTTNKLQDKLNTRELELNKKEEIIRDLEFSAREFKDAVKSKSDELDRKEDQVKKLSQGLADLNSKMRSQLNREDESLLKFDISRLEKERKNWEDLYNNVSQELNEKRKELNDSKISLISFKQTRFDLDEKISELEHKIKERDNNLNTLQSYSESQDERIASYIKNIDQLDYTIRTQQDAFLKENDNLRGLLKTFEKAVSDQGIEISKFQRKEEASKQRFDRTESDFNEEKNKYAAKIADLERQLKTLNDDMAPSGNRVIGGNIHSLVVFNKNMVAGAAEDGVIVSADGEEGKTFERPSIFIEKYHNLEKQLIEEKTARRKAEIYLQDILQAEKNQKPIRAKEQLDYQRLLNHRDVLEQKIESSYAEISRLSMVSQEKIQEAEKAKKDLSIQQLLVSDMSTQIQHLMLQSHHNGNYKASEAELYDEFISFSNLGELQKRNQNLLEVINTLKEDYSLCIQHEDAMNAKEAQNMKELESLREDRKLMEQSISVLSQERDVFKAMSEEFAASNSSQSNSESSLSSLISQIGQLKMDLSDERDLKAKHLQRIAKFEEMQKFYEEELNKTKEESSRLCGDLAKASSDSRFNSEKIMKLEHNFTITQADLKGQVERFTVLESKYQALSNSNHSKDIEVRNLMEEKRNALESLRKAHGEVEVAKSSEARYKQQLQEARNQAKSDSDLFDEISKIEFTLSQKYESENQMLKNERDDLLRSNDHFRKENKNLTDESRSRTLEEEIKVLTSKLENKEQEVSRINQDLIRESKLKEDFQDQKLSSERQIKQLQDRISQLQNSNSIDKTIESQNKDRDIALQLTEAELEKLRQQLKQTETRSDQLQELMKSTEANKDAMHSTLASIRKKFEEETKAKDSEIDTLKRERENLKSNSKSSVMEVEESNDSLRAQIKQCEVDKGKVLEELKLEKIQNTSLLAKISSINADSDKFQQVARDAYANYQRELQLHAISEGELNKSQSTIERLYAELKDKESTIESLKDTLAEKEALIAASSRNFEMSSVESNSKIEALTDVNNKLKEQIKVFRSEMDKFETCSGSVSRNKSASDTDNLEDESEVESSKKGKYLSLKESEISTKNELLNTKNELLNSAWRQIDELKSQLKELQSRLQSSNSHFTRTEEEFTKVKNLASQLDVYLDDNNNLRKEREEIRKKLSSCELELTQAQGRLEPLKREVNGLTDQNSRLNSDRNDALAEAKACKDRLVTYIARFNEIDPLEHAQLKRDLEKANDTVQAAASALTENSALKARLDDLSSKLAAEGASNESLRKQVDASSESSKKQLEASSESFKKQLEESKVAYDTLNKRVQELDSKLKAKLANNEALKKQLDESKTHESTASEALKKRVDTLEEELASANQIAVNEGKRASKFRDQCIEFKTKHKELEKELQIARTSQSGVLSAPTLSTSLDIAVTPHSSALSRAPSSSVISATVVSMSTAPLVAPALSIPPPPPPPPPEIIPILSESGIVKSKTVTTQELVVSNVESSAMDIEASSSSSSSSTTTTAATSTSTSTSIAVSSSISIASEEAPMLSSSMSMSTSKLNSPLSESVVRVSLSNIEDGEVIDSSSSLMASSSGNDNSMDNNSSSSASSAADIGGGMVISSASSEENTASPSSSLKKRPFGDISGDNVEQSPTNSSDVTSISSSSLPESKKEASSAQATNAIAVVEKPVAGEEKEKNTSATSQPGGATSDTALKDKLKMAMLKKAKSSAPSASSSTPVSKNENSSITTPAATATTTSTSIVEMEEEVSAETTSSSGSTSSIAPSSAAESTPQQSNISKTEARLRKFSKETAALAASTPGAVSSETNIEKEDDVATTSTTAATTRSKAVVAVAEAGAAKAGRSIVVPGRGRGGGRGRGAGRS